MILKDLKARLEPPLSFSLEFAPSAAAVPCLFPWTALLYPSPDHPRSSVFQFLNTPMGKVNQRDKKPQRIRPPLVPAAGVAGHEIPRTVPGSSFRIYPVSASPFRSVYPRRLLYGQSSGRFTIPAFTGLQRTQRCQKILVRIRRLAS